MYASVKSPMDWMLGPRNSVTVTPPVINAVLRDTIFTNGKS